MELTTLTNEQIYIHELSEPFEKLAFQFVPDEIVYERTGNWANIPIVGRNNSKKQLTGGEDRLTLTLDFNGLYETNKNHCMKQLGFLRSLTMNDGFNGPSRNVKIAWGSLFRFNVWVVKSVRGRLSQFNSKFNMSPMQLVVDVEFELDPKENQGISDVRGLDIRNINDTINTNSNVA